MNCRIPGLRWGRPLVAWWLLLLQMAGGMAATAEVDIRWRGSSMPEHAEFVGPGIPFYNLDVAAAPRR